MPCPRLRPLLLLAALLPAIGIAADAQTPSYHFAVTPFAGYRMGGNVSGTDDANDIGLDDAASIGLILNMPATGYTAEAGTEWELYASRQTAGIDDAADSVDPALEIEISHILLGGTYVVDGERMRPFVAAGIGAAHLSPDAAGYDSDTVFAFGIGGGAYLFPDSPVGLRLEGRLLGAVIDSDSALFCQSGPEGSACAFRTSGDVLWQFEVFAGLVARF